MSESKTVIYSPDGGSTGGGNGMMAMLAPLLQQKGIDPNLLVAMQGNKGNNGFGGDGSWLWIIFLFFLFPLFNRGGWGNGGFGGNDGGNGGGYGAAGIPNLINNDAGRELLMSAIQGNGNAINQLASTLNCSVGQIQQSINAVTTQLQSVGSQVGMSTNQIINAINSGNCQIAQSVADCCCRTQNAITTQGYENQLAMCNQTNSLQNTMNANTLALRDGATANNQAILAKLDAMQNQALQDKIAALTANNATLTAEISQRNQNATILNSVAQQINPLVAGIQGLQSEVDAIKCRMPQTVPVIFPNIKAYNADVYQAAAAGAYAGDMAANAYNGCGC